MMSSLSASCLLMATLAFGGETVELHAENYDEILDNTDEILVHFYAPCTPRTHFHFSCMQLS